MAVNKVEYGGETLIDLTSDSVTPQTLAEGETAHNAAGETIEGTLKVQDEIVVTTGSSTAYEATVRGITELKAGVNFIMIPHVNNTASVTSLNVNELGARLIYRPRASSPPNISMLSAGYIRAGVPYRVMYSIGDAWILTELPKTDATDLYGKLPIDKIATSADNKGKVLTTNDNGVAEWQEPSGGGESMLGEWVFNEEITAPPSNSFEIAFVAGGINFVEIAVSERDIFYSTEIGDDSYPVYNLATNIWSHEIDSPRYIKIFTKPSAEAAAWIKANAKRYAPIGVDRVKIIDTWDGDMEEVIDNGDGISWYNHFAFINDNGYVASSGSVDFKIPIVAGKNIDFTYDEENNAIAINATGGGSGGNTLKPSEGLEYTLSTDGTYYIVSGIGTCTDDFVIIPSEYEGLPVTNIDGYAFGHPVYSDETPTFTKIFIPKSITGGMYGVFANNVSVKTIYCEAETQPDGWYPDWQPTNAEVIWGYKLEGEDDKTPAMPTIRFSNAFDNNGSWIIDESNPINFTVEVMSGKVQEGDLLQICVRRMYKKNDRKIWRLRRVVEKELSSENIGQQFLCVSSSDSVPAEQWLFKNDRNSNRSDTKSSIYLRIKRVTKYNPDGIECNAIFSNIVEINKTFNPSTFKVTIK